MAFISQIIQQHPDAGYWHQQYPWFSIGHLVDASNKKDTPAFTESARRTAVFFNNIPRLHWLLHQPEVDIAALQALLHTQKEIVQTDSETEDVVAKTGIIIPETDNNDDRLNPAEEAPETEETVMPETDAGTTVAEIIAEPALKESTEVNIVVEIAGEPNEATQSLTTAENLQEPNIEVLTPELSKNENLKERASDDHTWDPKIENVLSEHTIEETIETTEAEDVETEESELIQLPTSMLSESLAQAADSFKNAQPDDETIIFKTAYQHTIDYFASQGIKLDSEPAKDDRFGQQLKTFTSWLRQMKPLPGTPLPEADPLVESHAAHSLQKGEVVTEPMADVLLKQGKTGHAIAVLEKLRLLHPQKSHYFAARIDQIKHT